MKSTYDIKGDQIFDILTAGMNSVYSDEMNDVEADQLLFELKNEFVNKLYDFENLLVEFRNDLREVQNLKDSVSDALKPANNFEQITF
jgi:hypothetical protein